MIKGKKSGKLANLRSWLENWRKEGGVASLEIGGREESSLWKLLKPVTLVHRRVLLQQSAVAPGVGNPNVALKHRIGGGLWGEITKQQSLTHGWYGEPTCGGIPLTLHVRLVAFSLVNQSSQIKI